MSECITGRTLSAVDELFNHAKLDQSCSSGSVQVVGFSPDLASDEYNLFQVSSDLVTKLCKPGSRVVLQLKDDEQQNPLASNKQVFGCTEQETYQVVEAETSNCLLLLPNWSIPSSSTGADSDRVAVATHVEAMKSTYFEFHRCCAPSLRSLKQTLQTTIYRGPAEEVSDSETDTPDDDTVRVGKRRYTRQELGNKFPCSQADLNQAFLRLRICEIDGWMRLIESEYLTQVGCSVHEM